MQRARAALATIAFVLAATLGLRAQQTTTPLQSIQTASADELNTLLEAIEATPPLPAEAGADGSTFYSAQHSETSAEPWPPLPCNPLGLPVWDLGEGVFLLDDLEVSYDALVGAQAETRAMLGDDALEGGGYSPAYSFSTNGLWLAVATNSMAVSNQFGIVLHNAAGGQPTRF